MVAGKLRIGGAWSGSLDVELDDWTVAALRQEVANRSDCVDPNCINLIFAGRVLRDGDGSEKLAQLGLKNNAKILASRVSVDQDGKSIKDEFLAEEERSKRLTRLRDAATSLAGRHADGSLPVEDFNLELENQRGEKVQLGSETDQRAIMMGLMLHANGKALLRREQYRDALEVLTMGEEAFSLCDPKLIEMVDNVPILQIDMVWCYLMLRDVSWLSVAGVRLTKAREGIERAHGKESTRLRILQGGRHPELALHLRLELLEGVVAYHNGQLQKSKEILTSAQAKFLQLQIPDETLALLIGMGYKEDESKRALRMNNMDIGSAVDFLVEERAKRAREREENLRRQKEILEQKQYGVTPLRKAVDIQMLNELVSIGFEKCLAAEALRKNENDMQMALDDLTNPETNAALQNEVISRKRRRLNKETSAARENLLSMGFSRELVEAALRMFRSEEQALNHLLGQVNESTANTAVATDGSAAAAAAGSNAASAAVADDESNAAAAAADDESNAAAADSLADGSIAEGSGEGSLSQSPPQVRDVEMEDLLTDELQNADAYSDYDIQVTNEGEALAQYLALLESAESPNKTSSSSQ